MSQNESEWRKSSDSQYVLDKLLLQGPKLKCLNRKGKKVIYFLIFVFGVPHSATFSVVLRLNSFWYPAPGFEPTTSRLKDFSFNNYAQIVCETVN